MIWKKLTFSIPQNRLLSYLLVIGLLPFILVFLYFFNLKKEWGVVDAQIHRVHELNRVKDHKQQFNNLVRAKYADVDPLYIEEKFETLSLLKRETESLERLIQSATFTGNATIERRYSTLTHENFLKFVESSIQNGEGFQETTLILANPIEVDGDDIQKILNLIEGEAPHKPQLIISDFKIAKKSPPGGNEIFELNLKFYKREFLK